MENDEFIFHEIICHEFYFHDNLVSTIIQSFFSCRCHVRFVNHTAVTGIPPSIIVGYVYAWSFLICMHKTNHLWK